MGLIGIKSSIITLLAILAYGLLVQLLGIQTTIWGHLEQLVFALGIYSGPYYYKHANKGCMTYSQGVQIGLIVVAFTGLISGLLTYVVSQFIDPGFIKRLLAGIQQALQQDYLKPENNQQFMELLEAHLTPLSLLAMIVVTTCLTGFIWTLIIAYFSKSDQQKADS